MVLKQPPPNFFAPYPAINPLNMLFIYSVYRESKKSVPLPGCAELRSWCLVQLFSNTKSLLYFTFAS